MMTQKSEPDFFYMKKETGEISWNKPKGEFQNTFVEIQNTFTEMFGRVDISPAQLNKSKL